MSLTCEGIRCTNAVTLLHICDGKYSQGITLVRPLCSDHRNMFGETKCDVIPFSKETAALMVLSGEWNLLERD